MNRNARYAIAVSTILALAACEQDRTAPTGAAGPAAAGPEAAGAVSGGTVVEEGACPCWTARSLGAAFPVASFYHTDLAVEARAGRAALQLSDIANARVLQALVAFDPEASAEGDNWCQVATFGTSGLERESISALKISAEEFGACVSLLEQRAGAAGLAATTD